MDLLATTPGFESHAKLLIEASEANIARIESQIRDLERLRDRERGIIIRLRIAIAPVHKLPAELLVEIFRYTCEATTSSVKRTVKKVQALTHVCAYWRRVAITTPQLWTQILRISLNRKPTDAYLAGLKEWVERSAPLPISVWFSSSLAPGEDAASRVVEVFVTAADRWSSADLRLPSLSVLSRIPLDALKCLRTLNLRSRDGGNYAAMDTFLLARNLRTVSLDARTARLRMPWSQLAHIDLDLEMDSPRHCLDILLQCTNVVSAKVKAPAWPDHPDLSQISLTTLGRLERLEISISDDSGFITPFFARFVMPALKRLTLDLDFDLEWSTAEFTQFQLRSPNIEYLSISYSYINSGELMAMLRHTPVLSELALTCCRYAFDESIMAGLRYSPQNTSHLVPRLQVLSVTEGCDDLDEDTLDALIASRWWTAEQLAAFPAPPGVSRWLSIDIDRDDDDDVSPQLEAKLDEYRAQGLDVQVA